MTILRITFLGTSAAAPTIRRGLSGIAVRAHTERLLIDCGEGSQRQMLRFGTGLRVERILFTHFHADHYLGVVGLLRTLAMHDRTEPLVLHGPAPHLHTLLERIVHLGFERMPFGLSFETASGGTEIDRRDYRIRAVAVKHRTPALGWVIEEPQRPGVFDRERAVALGVPVGPLFGALQRGESVTTPAGETVHPSDVLGPARPGRKVVFSGDTRPCDALVDAARDADVLVHEATFTEADRERAIETSHSTALEAGTIAARAGARRLVLTHLSSRYDNLPHLLRDEAAKAFAGPIEVAEDGLEIEVPRVG